jgi:hypothetical protein
MSGGKSMNKHVVARYSILKVGAWTIGVTLSSVWLLAYEASKGWRIPEGVSGLLLGGAVLGAFLGPLYSLALIVNLALARGVAIAKVEDEFVLYFPLSRKRIPLAGVSVSARDAEVDVPNYGQIGLFKTSKIFAPQVTIQRSGQPDISFRTGLLKEASSVIAGRMSTFLGSQ